MYSPRPRTKAAESIDNIDKSEKIRRLSELINLQSDITYKINKSYEGKTTDVLIEGFSNKNTNILMGRNRQNKIVNFVSNKLLEQGTIAQVKITEGKKILYLASLLIRI